MQNIQEILEAHKLSNQEYEKIKKILKKEPNLLEIGIFSAMWSEHCSYKSSKKYLNGFPTKAPWVIQGPGENAGVIDIGDNKAAVFKVESHNHPSFIEPFQGAATGVGGILRDIFTMGARPLANMNSIRFGHIESDTKTAKLNRHLLKGVVDGISFYGNCMGIAMLGGETSFEDCYDKNNLVNAFALGIANKDKIFYGKTGGLKNPIIYVGSKTGKDGLGGAVMSSDSFSSEVEQKKPTVQVGDPFTEKLLLEACMELFETDYIVGIQDMGAAGLTSSAFEMASRGNNGMILDIDKIPARESNMTPYDFMLSESQERMLICAKLGHEEKVIEIFKKYELEACVVGEVTDTGCMEIFWQNKQVCNIPIEDVTNEAPILDRDLKKPAYLEKTQKISKSLFVVSPEEALKTLLSHPEVADKAWIYNQYDSTIGQNSISKLGKSESGVMRVKDTNKALAMSIDCNARFCYLDPKLGAAAAVCQAGRNVAMSGAKPLAISDCLNFGNPQNPETMWQFKEATDGIKEACVALNTPVVSGNVSLYNETNQTSIYPTPTIAMVGLIDDFRKTLTPEFKEPNNSVYLVGNTSNEFGGSLFLKVFNGEVAGGVPKLDLEEEKKLWDLSYQANKEGLLESAMDLSLGGACVALAKMTALSKYGFEGVITLSDENILFSESFSRAIFEVKPENEDKFEDMLEKRALAYEKIGKVTAKNFVLNSISLDTKTIKDLYFNSFSKLIEKDI